MSDSIETRKNNPKTQKKIELNAKSSSNQSYKTLSQMKKKALIHRRIYEQAIEIIGETFGDMDEEMEIKNSKKNFSTSKIGISDKQNLFRTNKMEQLELTEFLDLTDGFKKEIR